MGTGGIKEEIGGGRRKDKGENERKEGYIEVERKKTEMGKGG